MSNKGIFSLFCAALAICCLSLPFSARAEMTYVYNSPETGVDFERSILQIALERTQNAYGSFTMRPAAPMSVSRQISELEQNTGAITVTVLPSSASLEERLLPIRIPLEKGLLGYRIMLIRGDDQVKFDAIRTLADLAPVKFGQKFDWEDADILKENGLFVETGSSYDGLFKMLTDDRFDALLRGSLEIIDEFNAHKEDLPGIKIERGILIHYTLPIYFFFSKNPDGAALAKRVEAGMRGMIEDGTYDILFRKYSRPMLQQLDFAHRRLFELRNPFLDPATPLTEKRLWVEPQEFGGADGRR